MMRIQATLALTGALLLLPLAGCRDELTQIVVVVQSDLIVPTEVDGLDVTSIEGPFEPPVSPFFNRTTESLGKFPLSVGFQSGGATRSFSAVLRLFIGVTQTSTPTLVMSRALLDVRFVSEQTMMLVVPMNRECACNGTNCPSIGDPACDNLENPEVVPFDPAVAPPSQALGPTPGFGQPPPRL
jgi:hypothetical protein